MAFKNTRSVEEPVETTVDRPGGGQETKMTHPAFAQISASRVSGQAILYGSDFVHHNYITLTITDSEVHRSLSNDWHFPRGRRIEVALSEAQWASLVSSLNVGSGVPCTRLWERSDGYVARLPTPKSRADQFGAEFQKDFDEALVALDELRESLEASGLSKKKMEDLLAKAARARSRITSAAPFVADQFGEHMENEMERAKAEIHGYATGLIQRAGIEALSGQSPVTLSLEDKSE